MNLEQKFAQRRSKVTVFDGHQIAAGNSELTTGWDFIRTDQTTKAQKSNFAWHEQRMPVLVVRKSGTKTSQPEIAANFHKDLRTALKTI